MDSNNHSDYNKQLADLTWNFQALKSANETRKWFKFASTTIVSFFSLILSNTIQLKRL